LLDVNIPLQSFQGPLKKGFPITLLLYIMEVKALGYFISHQVGEGLIEGILLHE
jgi:hypothetical protein